MRLPAGAGRGAATLLLVLAIAPATARAGSRAVRPPAYSAGAAVIDITPRASDTDPNRFHSRCSATFSGRRSWADDEPYIDVSRNGRYDFGEPFCDPNANLRRDQIYTSGASIGSPVPALGIHDPLQARAFAVSDGSRTAVVVSVVAQGLFNTYIDRMTAGAKALAPSISAMIVSANHNESSPDTVGIYGGPAPPDSPAGVQSGIDDYYMDFLVRQVAIAGARAARSLRPATLWARQTRLPSSISVRLSDNWPTTGPGAAPAAIDPKLGVLQARGRSGRPIFTVMSLAAHNQEIGHSGSAAMSADWPGYFQRSLDARVSGTGLFLVGANGSQEDPQTEPPLSSKGADAGTYAQARATGLALARLAANQASRAQRLRYGGLRHARSRFCVPIENNLFKAAAAAGLFGRRVTFLRAGQTCVPAGFSGMSGPTLTGPPDSLMTSVGLLDIGPDLQLLTTPGEAFPALVQGSPWGIEDVPAACASRPNPPVPNWRSHGQFRFQVGLADDMIGYEIPPWAYLSEPGAFLTSDFRCATTNGSRDAKGHRHKLETEGVGPAGSFAVADELARLVGADAPDPSVRIARGRYVRADGSYSQFPAGAAGILVAPDVLIASRGVRSFGMVRPGAHGFFMDYDGQPQRRADVTTRGMMIFDAGGCVARRYYLDEFPRVGALPRLGQVVRRPTRPVRTRCHRQPPGVPGVQAAAGAAAGL